MSRLAAPLPCRRPDLVIRPLGDGGRYVIKDPSSGAFFEVGDEEHFLLAQLDGKRAADEIRAAFAERFGAPLTEEDLDEFLKLARTQGFLQTPNTERHPVEQAIQATTQGQE